MVKIEHPDIDSVVKKHEDELKADILERNKSFHDFFTLLSQTKKLSIADLPYADFLKNSSTLFNTLITLKKKANSRNKEPISINGINNIKELKGNSRPKATSLLRRIISKSAIGDLSLFSTYVKEHLIEPDENILNSVPSKLADLESEFVDKCNTLFPKSALADLKAFMKLYFDKILDYKAFSVDSKGKKWDAYSLTNELNINVCPFCNQNYTYTLINGSDGKGIIRPDLDHFLDKGTHPLLQVSFYNLVPSCLQCNSRLKNQKKFKLCDHLHPYENNFDEFAKFVFIYNTSNADKRTDFRVRIEKKLGVSKSDYKKVENNSVVFALEDQYNKHSDIIEEIHYKAIKYNGNYIKQLRGIFKTKTEEELYKYIFGNYFEDENMGKRPLARLTRDIFNDIMT